MKNIKLNVLAGLLLASSAAFGGIVGSPHDLSASTTGLAENGELCVFCHTPHAASTAMTGAPLWNKADVNASTFTLYGATLGVSANGTDDTVNNQSLACLSCHDGVSSIDSIVNAPGSGLNSVDTVTLIQNIGTYQGVANLTKNLTNTHPISIKYIVGNASLRDTATELISTPNNLQAWSGVSTIADLLRGVDSDRVECGSCHDPHNGYGTGDSASVDLYGTSAAQSRTVEVNFLRHSNKGSALCLGCHGK